MSRISHLYLTLGAVVIVCCTYLHTYVHHVRKFNNIFVANFQEAVITHSFYKAILESVEKHISNEVLVEVAFEIFIILSLNSKFCYSKTYSSL